MSPNDDRRAVPPEAAAQLAEKEREIERLNTEVRAEYQQELFHTEGLLEAAEQRLKEAQARIKELGRKEHELA